MFVYNNVLCMLPACVINADNVNLLIQQFV